MEKYRSNGGGVSLLGFGGAGLDLLAPHEGGQDVVHLLHEAVQGRDHVVHLGLKDLHLGEDVGSVGLKAVQVHGRDTQRGRRGEATTDASDRAHVPTDAEGRDSRRALGQRLVTRASDRGGAVVEPSGLVRRSGAEGDGALRVDHLVRGSGTERDTRESGRGSVLVGVPKAEREVHADATGNHGGAETRIHDVRKGGGGSREGDSSGGGDLIAIQRILRGELGCHDVHRDL
jgi:hypothetical protein